MRSRRQTHEHRKRRCLGEGLSNLIIMKKRCIHLLASTSILLASCGSQAINTPTDTVSVNLSYTYVNDLQAYFNSTLIEGEVYIWNTENANVTKVADSIYSDSAPVVRQIGDRSGESVTGVGLNITGVGKIASARFSDGIRTRYIGTGLERRDFSNQETVTLLSNSLTTLGFLDANATNLSNIRYVVISGGIEVDTFQVRIEPPEGEKGKVEISTALGEVLDIEISGSKSRTCGVIEEAATGSVGGEIPCLIIASVYRVEKLNDTSTYQIFSDNAYSKPALASSFRSLSE